MTFYCPYCEEEHDYDDYSLSLGENEEITCEWCGEAFIVATALCLNTYRMED